MALLIISNVPGNLTVYICIYLYMYYSLMKNSTVQHSYQFISFFFFNFVFNSGLVPEEWLVGIIKTLYKNKDDPTSPENYRLLRY